MRSWFQQKSFLYLKRPFSEKAKDNNLVVLLALLFTTRKETFSSSICCNLYRIACSRWFRLKTKLKVVTELAFWCTLNVKEGKGKCGAEDQHHRSLLVNLRLSLFTAVVFCGKRRCLVFGHKAIKAYRATKGSIGRIPLVANKILVIAL